jgi:hypothetical protein
MLVKLIADDFETQNLTARKTTTTTRTTSTTKTTTTTTTTLKSPISTTKISDFDTFEVDNNDDFFSEVESDSGTLKKIEDKSLEILSIGEYFSIESYPDPYCEIVNKMPTVCLELSLLELWAHDGHYDEVTDQEIENLTTESILEKINTVNKSGVFLTNKNFADYLGGITYDDQGKIIGAKASIIRWFGTLNATDALLNPVIERNEPIDRKTLEFEGEMITAMLNTSGYPEGLESYPNVQRSFGDIAGSTILGDISYMTIGFMIVYAYVMLMLGKFRCQFHQHFTRPFFIQKCFAHLISSYGMAL